MRLPYVGLTTLASAFVAILTYLSCQDRAGQKREFNLSKLKIELFKSSQVNGEKIPWKEYTEVVNVLTSRGTCTATIVGPRVAITSAHCEEDGHAVTLQTDYKEFEGVFEHSNYYDSVDHDLAVIILKESIPNYMIHFATVTGSLTYGMKLDLIGFGCKDPEGAAELRLGKVTASAFSGFDVVGTPEGAGPYCFSETSGPVYLTGLDRIHFLVGITAKGFIRDQSYSVRMDIPESKKFLMDVAIKHKVDICGINDDCGAGTLTDPCPSF